MIKDSPIDIRTKFDSIFTSYIHPVPLLLIMSLLKYMFLVRFLITRVGNVGKLVCFAFYTTVFIKLKFERIFYLERTKKGRTHFENV